MTEFETKFQERYQKLNPAQQKAVDILAGPVLVLAGPGTGKTELLAMRVANILLKTDTAPHNILCLTFTDNGVFAMRSRLTQIIGPVAQQVQVHTFHSFCNQVITDHPAKFAFYQDMQSLSDLDKHRIFTDICEQLPLDSPLITFSSKDHYVRSLMSNIQSLKRENISPETYQELVDNLDKFLQQIEAPLANFTKIHHTKLTELDITQFVAEISSIDPAAPGIMRAIELELVKFSRGQYQKLTELRAAIRKICESALTHIARQKAQGLIYQQYQEQLVEKGRYDFEDMIMFVIREFKRNKELLLEYQERFQHILVDEFQDTNSAQNEAVSLLTESDPFPNLFVVGDDKQSIYRFQGAAMENVLQFHKVYSENISVVSLTQNYRSQQFILDTALGLIAHSEVDISLHVPDIDKNLKSFADHTQRQVDIVACADEVSELKYLTDEVKKLIETGVKPSEIAVLFRKNSSAANLSIAFDKSGINYRIDGGDDILESDLITNIVACLRYIANPGDSIALFHVLNLGFWKLNHLDLMKVSRYAARERLALVDVLYDAETLDSLELVDEAALKKIVSDLDELIEKAHQLQGRYLFDLLLSKSGLIEQLVSQTDRLKSLLQLNTFYDYIKNSNPQRITDLLIDVELMLDKKIQLPLQGNKYSTDAVVLMTAHKSKGLEFEYVFIYNALANQWESSRESQGIPMPSGLLKLDNGRSEKIEEERRLMFVAITRAKKHVYITYPKAVQDKLQQPSSFIQELPSLHVQTVQPEIDKIEALALMLGTQSKLSFLPAEQSWLRAQLEDYQMSVTHLNDYLRNPREFFFNHILRVPQSKTKSSALGTAIHNTLRDLHTILGRDGVLPDLGYLEKRYLSHLQLEHLEAVDYAEALEHGTKIIAKYYSNYQNDFHHDCLLEYDFRSHRVCIGDAKITGKLDKVEIYPDKKVKLVDYKTGNPDGKSAELAIDFESGERGSYYRQLAFYQCLASNCAEFKYEVIGCELDFVEVSKSKDEYVKKLIQITPDEQKQMEQLIQDVYSRIMNLEFPDLPGEYDKYRAIEWAS